MRGCSLDQFLCFSVYFKFSTRDFFKIAFHICVELLFKFFVQFSTVVCISSSFSYWFISLLYIKEFHLLWYVLQISSHFILSVITCFGYENVSFNIVTFIILFLLLCLEEPYSLLGYRRPQYTCVFFTYFQGFIVSFKSLTSLEFILV